LHRNGPNPAQKRAAHERRTATCCAHRIPDAPWRPAGLATAAAQQRRDPDLRATYHLWLGALGQRVGRHALPVPAELSSRHAGLFKREGPLDDYMMACPLKIPNVKAFEPVARRGGWR
jgi:hypothetical protein